MGERRGRLDLGGILAAVVLAPAGCVQVPGRAVTADVVGATGRLEVLRAGQSQWGPAPPSARSSSTLIACLPGPARPGASPGQCARDEAECGRPALVAGALDLAAFTRCMRDRGYDVRTDR